MVSQRRCELCEKNKVRREFKGQGKCFCFAEKEDTSVIGMLKPTEVNFIKLVGCASFVEGKPVAEPVIDMKKYDRFTQIEV
jgi:hypothetical protein